MNQGSPAINLGGILAMTEKITKEQFAQMLDGRVFDGHVDIFSAEELLIAKDSGLIIGYPGETDRMAFAGAYTGVTPLFNDVAISRCRGDTVFINQNGIWSNQCDCGSCPYAWEEQFNCKQIEALFKEKDGVEWSYETDIPHATFRLLVENYNEDEEGNISGIFCIGIVFEKSALA
jgi:hypothetical protein